MKNLTPKAYRCVMGGCPAVYADTDSYILVGDLVNHENEIDLVNKVSQGEKAVRLPRELIDAFVKEQSVK